MEETKTLLTILSLEEQAQLATLIATTTQLAKRVEKHLPSGLCIDSNILSMHSPTPWSVQYWRLKDTCGTEEREWLSLRATLEKVGMELHAVAHEIAESEKTTPPDTSLKKVKRVES